MPSSKYWRDKARKAWVDDNCQIDAEAEVSPLPEEDGAWVAAWVWVDDGGDV